MFVPAVDPPPGPISRRRPQPESAKSRHDLAGRYGFDFPTHLLLLDFGFGISGLRFGVSVAVFGGGWGARVDEFKNPLVG